MENLNSNWVLLEERIKKRNDSLPSTEAGSSSAMEGTQGKDRDGPHADCYTRI